MPIMPIMPIMARLPFVLVFVFIFIFSFDLPATSLAADIEQTWHIAYKQVNPDGVSKVVPVVNGQFPGPTLRGRIGQTVRITVHNHLPSETTTIHWHGIKQSGTVWSDGVPAVTQCPIQPGDFFVYEFKLDTPGTLWWHSHTAFQKSSLYGAIVIKGDEHVVGQYPERVLLLNDWFHDSQSKQMEGLFRPVVPVSQFRWVQNPQSLLINGRGSYNCTYHDTTCDTEAADANAGPFVLHVKPNSTYRLRVVGASSLTFLSFGFEHHDMVVVETETCLLHPFKTRALEVGSGQSYSVLLKTKTVEELAHIPQNNGRFWMRLDVIHRKVTPESRLRGFGILKYSDSVPGEPEPRRQKPQSPQKWHEDGEEHEKAEQKAVERSLRKIRRMKALRKGDVPRTANRVIMMLGTQNALEDGRLGWAMNNISFAEINGMSPVLHSVKYEVLQDTNRYLSETMLPPRDYDNTDEGQRAMVGTHVIKVEKDEVVDFVFVSGASRSNVHEVHPWHLHLHNFWELGHGDQGSTWTPKEEKKYNLKNPVHRNTFALFPYSWTAIRVKMDNPGVAHFHCHILPHLVMGMGFLVQIGEANDIPSPPPGTPFCGTISKLMAPPVRNPFVSGGCSA